MSRKTGWVVVVASIWAVVVAICGPGPMTADIERGGWRIPVLIVSRDSSVYAVFGVVLAFTVTVLLTWVARAPRSVWLGVLIGYVAVLAAALIWYWPFIAPFPAEPVVFFLGHDAPLAVAASAAALAGALLGSGIAERHEQRSA